MNLRATGEHEIVNNITEILGSRGWLKFKTGIGLGTCDDSAALPLNNDYLLVTTDTINEKTHIPSGASPYLIGWHIVAINLSDIAAMGGEPIGIVVAMGLPQNMDMKELRLMVRGMRDCASHYKIKVIGGDTKENPVLTLSGTAFGRVNKKRIMLRENARVGDIVCVTGELGRCAAAYYADKFIRSSSEKTATLMLKVFPRVFEGMILSASGVRCGIDISDGLAISLMQLSEASGVGFEIEFDKIPVAPEARKISEKTGIGIEEFSIYYGGDYELLITLPSKIMRTVSARMKRFGTRFTPIGKVISENENRLVRDGKRIRLEPRGYEHFKQR